METNKNILDHLKGKKQTSVDASYFENFQQNILKEIKADSIQSASPKPKVLYLRPLFWAASAAAIVVIIFATGVLFPEKEVHLAQLSDDEIESYLKENPVDESHSDLAGLGAIKIPEPGDTTKAKLGTTNEEKNKLASEVPGFKSSAQILEELSSEELYEFIESEEFEIEEEEITLLNQ